MKVLGIIPARAGSKRLPGKNKMLLNGIPIYKYIINTALKTSILEDIVFTTNDSEILNELESYTRLIKINRPEELSADESPAIDYVRHALNVVEQGSKRYDVIVILQPSSPLTLPEDIIGTVNLLEGNDFDSAVSVVKLRHMQHPLKLKKMEGSKLKPFIAEENNRFEAHKLDDVYVRNCSVYAVKREAVERGEIITENCAGLVMPPERSVDINDYADFLYAEFLMRKMNINAV